MENQEVLFAASISLTSVLRVVLFTVYTMIAAVGVGTIAGAAASPVRNERQLTRAEHDHSVTGS
jgi:hypothetical protein